MLYTILLTVLPFIGVGVLAWDRAKLKSKLTAVESELRAKKNAINISDITKVLNGLRADESNAKSHAYTMLSKMKSELNKLGGQ